MCLLFTFSRLLAFRCSFFPLVLRISVSFSFLFPSVLICSLQWIRSVSSKIGNSPADRIWSTCPMRSPRAGRLFSSLNPLPHNLPLSNPLLNLLPTTQTDHQGPNTVILIGALCLGVFSFFRASPYHTWGLEPLPPKPTLETNSLLISSACLSL